MVQFGPDFTILKHELEKQATMKTFRIIGGFLLIVSLGSMMAHSQDRVVSIKPESVCSNYINISGKSNINHFEFNMNFPSHEIFFVNNSFLTESPNDKIYNISIPVNNFEASNNLIFQDFLKLLKAKKYPKIIIGIGSDQLKNFLTSESYTDEPIKITIAGVTKEYNVFCIVNSCSDNLIYVSGYRNIKLTDFNLDPPKKFQGLVKVKDEVMINFGFVFSYKD